MDGAVLRAGGTMAASLRSPAAPHAVECLLLLLGVSFCWAISYVLIKLAVADIPPATVTAARLLLAAGILAARLRATGARIPPGWSAWGRYAGIALVGQVLPSFLIAWAETRITSTETAVLVATTPILVLLFSCVARETRPTFRVSSGTCLGFVGVAGFIGIGGESAVDGGWVARAGLILAAAGFAASAALVRSLRDNRPTVTGAAVTAIAAALLTPISLVADRPWCLSPSVGAVVAVIALGLISTAVAYVAYYRLLDRAGVAFASIHHYIVPVLALLFGAMLAGERVSMPDLAFAALVVLGVAMSLPGNRALVRIPLSGELRTVKALR